jgi:hypothetical protein
MGRLRTPGNCFGKEFLKIKRNVPIFTLEVNHVEIESPIDFIVTLHLGDGNRSFARKAASVL